MARLRYNGLSTTLGGSLTSGATSVTFAAALTYSGGTNVPTITGTDYIPLSILDSTGRLSEIVYLTAYTSAATTGTITRGQESTTGVSHASGDRVASGPTAVDISPIYVAEGNGAGSRTTSSTTLSNLTDMSITLPATTGDVLVVDFFAIVSDTSSSDPIYWRPKMASTSGHDSYTTCSIANTSFQATSMNRLVVAAGDISSGSVTVVMQWAQLTSGTATVYNESGNGRRPVMTVTNLGH